MFEIPKFGWSHFKLDNFSAPISYLTDVPFDLLNAFILYREIGSCSIYFDCEGWSFTIVLTPYRIYIIEEKDIPKLIEIESITVDEFISITVNDIKTNLDDWLSFLVDDDENHEKNKEKLESLLAKINN